MATVNSIPANQEFETLCLHARNLMNAGSRLLHDSILDDRDNELWMAVSVFDKAQEEFEQLVRAHWRDFRDMHSEIRRLRAALEERAAA